MNSYSFGDVSNVRSKYFSSIKTLLERLEGPIELVATLDGSDKSAKIKELVEEIAQLSDLVTARFDGTNKRAPSFGVAKPVNSLVCSSQACRWAMSLRR